VPEVAVEHELDEHGAPEREAGDSAEVDPEASDAVMVARPILA